MTGSYVELPAELGDALDRLAELRAVARRRKEKTAAVMALGRLLRAATDAGWPPWLLADHLAMTGNAVRQRIRIDRQAHPDSATGLEIPAAPPRLPPRPALPPKSAKPPLDQRTWLRRGEALELFGIHRNTLIRWRLAGLLPSTRLDGTGYLYARADLIAMLDRRVRCRNGGIDYEATRRALGLPDSRTGAA